MHHALRARVAALAGMATFSFASLRAAHVGPPALFSFGHGVLPHHCCSGVLSILLFPLFNLQPGEYGVAIILDEKKRRNGLVPFAFGSVLNSLISLWLSSFFWCTVFDGICSSQFALLSFLSILYLHGISSLISIGSRRGARWLIAVAIVWKCVYGNYVDETA